MTAARKLAAELAAEAARLDHEQLSWGWAVRNAVGVGLTLFAGIATGHTDWGLFASIGAFVVGFGDIGSTRSGRIRSMLACAAGAFLSALVGALTAEYTALAILAIAIWGGVFGLLMSLGPVEAMAGRVAVLTLILIGDDPSSPDRALEIATVVVAGGLLQTALALLPTSAAASAESSVRPELRLKTTRDAASWNDVFGRHAIRLAVALSVGLLLYRVAPIGHGLWVPLTVLFVLLPDAHQTESKVFQRIAGTLSGVLVVTALVTLVDPGVWLMAALATLFVIPTYALLRPNYALFSGSIAAFVVLLVSIAGVPEQSVALYRTIDTLIGSAIAIAVTLLIPMPRKRATS